MYRRYVKPAGLDPKRIKELDALEVYHPGGIPGSVEKVFARFAGRGEVRSRGRGRTRRREARGISGGWRRGHIEFLEIFVFVHVRQFDLCCQATGFYSSEDII